MTVPAIGALLNNIPTVWAVPLAAFIGAKTYDLTQLCITDPPPVPEINAADVLALINPYNPFQPGDTSKFDDLITAFLWYQVCRCDSVSTPAPPAPPSIPDDFPDLSPTGATGGVLPAQPCGTTDSGVVPGPNSLAQFVYGPIELPPGRTLVAVDGTWVSGSTQPLGLDIRSGSTTTLASATQRAVRVCSPFEVPACTWSHGETLHLETTAGLSDRYWWCTITNQSTDSEYRVVFNTYCGGGSSSPAPTSPYVPDPLTIALLQQILEYVKLIQRQRVPFAYNRGTEHTGLSGNGEIEVQGLIGAIVQLTATPSNVGFQDGEPDVVFEAGWLNWGNSDGFSPRQFISCSPQVSFPSVAGQYTRIGYSLSPGVEATITELVREP